MEAVVWYADVDVRSSWIYIDIYFVVGFFVLFIIFFFWFLLGLFGEELLHSQILNLKKIEVKNTFIVYMYFLNSKMEDLNELAKD